MPTSNQRVGEYVLRDRISAGTFGEVWRAHHHVWTDQVVAVKIPTDPQYLRNLQREGVAIHGLTHPNVVRAIGFDPYADPAYLTMEYIPGSSLRPLIQKKALGISDAVSVLRQMLAGLGHAHAQGLVHRDIKPENILVHQRAFKDGFGADGVIKVTDFGLGRGAATAGGGSIAYSASLDGAAGKEIAGTLDYMAPEQRAGGAVDARADLNAGGVVLYEMLTGERPAGTDVPSDVNPEVPKHLDDVFRRSYARLDKRFGSAEEFARALVAPAPPPLPAPPVQPKSMGGVRYAPVPPVPGMPPIPSTRPSGVVSVGAPSRTACPQCRQSVDPGDQFCMHCGVQLVENVRRCPQCGAYPDGSDQYCIFCGQTLTAVHQSA
jgi:serine/threonine protein kinase